MKMLNDPVVRDIIGLTENIKAAATGCNDKGPGALHALLPILGVLGWK